MKIKTQWPLYGLLVAITMCATLSAQAEQPALSLNQALRLTQAENPELKAYPLLLTPSRC